MFTYILALPTNYNQPPYLLIFYHLLAKTFTFWQNFIIIIKPLLFKKTFLFHG
jgi:hypothetical protein